MTQTWVKTSQNPCVISPNPVGHSDKVMKHSKSRSLLDLCIMHPISIPIIFISTEYPGNSLIWISSYQAGKPLTLSVRGIVQLENEIWFLILKNVNRWYWQMLLKDTDISVVVRFPLDFHKVPYSPQYYVTVYFVFAHWVTFLHTSPELWKRRLHESVLFVIQLGRSWLSDDIISVPWPSGRYNFWRSSLGDVQVVGDQIGTCFAGTSGWFCWPLLGCDEVNRLFVSGVYHNYTGRGWIPLFALDKFCAVSIVIIPKFRHCFHHCRGY